MIAHLMLNPSMDLFVPVDARIKYKVEQIRNARIEGCFTIFVHSLLININCFQWFKCPAYNIIWSFLKVAFAT